MEMIEYWAQVRAIETQNPNEPLLERLQSGPSVVTLAYLKAALARLPEQQAEAAEDSDDEEEEDIRPDDPVFAAFTRQIREGYQLMRRLHNQYHDCRSEDDFQRIANQMSAAWDDTQKVIELRTEYVTTGVVPSATEDDLPDNTVLLAKKLNSLRSSITQYQSAIKKAAAQGNEERVKMLEDKRKKAILLRGIAEQRLESRQEQ